MVLNAMPLANRDNICTSSSVSSAASIRRRIKVSSHTAEVMQDKKINKKTGGHRLKENSSHYDCSQSAFCEGGSLLPTSSTSDNSMHHTK
jgi:hypothetical protein